MRRRALAAGVPDSAIVVDETGVDTAATVREARRLVGSGSALLVTHYYHEPRLVMLAEREGLRAWTVPATMSRHLVKEPRFVLRELLAFYRAFLVQ